MKVIMFPGQGSQKLGMGEGLLQNARYQQILQEANDILGYDANEMILGDENSDKLNNTLYTQPLLYLVSGLSWMEEEKMGTKADIFIGHSLGEYNALQAAGAFDFLTGLKLVKKRAELMANSQSGGGMVAVLGLDDEVVEKAITDFSGVEVANYNSPGQVVLTGDKKELEELEESMKELGARRYVFLPVSGAFHSQFMKKSAEDFYNFLNDFELVSPKVTVYSNVDAATYGERSVRELLSQQIYSSVQWVKTIKAIKSDKSESEFLEIGPGQVLTGLVKRI